MTEDATASVPPLPIRTQPLGELVATSNVGIMDNNDPIDAAAIWNMIDTIETVTPTQPTTVTTTVPPPFTSVPTTFPADSRSVNLNRS